MAELVDALDSKSSSRKGVWVRFPPSVLKGSSSEEPFLFEYSVKLISLTSYIKTKEMFHERPINIYLATNMKIQDFFYHITTSYNWMYYICILKINENRLKMII